MTEERHLVLGTAGHIDHGKTALIKALTGVDTDRLAEEKERGISIELGYAELELPSGTRLSVIDVPGHERFVRNMVAGASGIDIFLLVVAADDGVMPQTREHMAIIEMLGIPRGVVAITKSDLVDEEMLELVQADIEEFLSGTAYPGTPITTVSSKTAAGVPLLLGLLETAADESTAHESAGPARLPIDRVFTLKGIGTVVTGTLWSGRICDDDAVTLMPEGVACRARAVQVHDQPVECAEAGRRVALNLTGVDRERIERGQMVVRGEGLEPTYMVDAHIRLLPGAPTLKYGAQARLHHGTLDATAKLMFADRDRLEPGGSCYAQVRLKTRFVPARGDRFILRSLSPVTTIGGGTVIDPHPKKHGQGDDVVNRLLVLESGSAAEIAALLLDEASPGGLTLAELAGRSQLPEGGLTEALADAGLAAAVPGPGGDVYFAAAAHEMLRQRITAALEEKQKKTPAEPALAAEALAKATGLDPQGRDLQALLAHMVEEGVIAARKQLFTLASAEARLSDRQRALMERVVAALDEAGMSPPSTTELARVAGAGGSDLKVVLKHLEESGGAVRIKPDLYYAPGPLEQARQAVIDHCQAGERITLAEFRDALGISRKFAQALMEYFDRAGLTRRIEDYRVLRKKGMQG
ncbi:MAG: selenocysteine-specific translation elongation factor [Gaiellales bacterium]|nr:MAG: selenocysteine-specific translation elongation factor [Gaiellales bacterium]